MGCKCKERREAIVGAVKTAVKGLTIISGATAVKK